MGRCPTSKSDYVCARDNFFLAACYATRTDLTELFTGTFRWPVSDTARGVLETMLAVAAVDE